MAQIIVNDRQLEALMKRLNVCALPITVSIQKGAKRRLVQNALAHKWFAEIARETGETSASVKARCKFDHALPIIEASNTEWIERWEPYYSPLIQSGSREALIGLFEILPMTRIFTVKQMSEFMTSVRREHHGMGIYLTDPEMMKYEAGQ